MLFFTLCWVLKNCNNFPDHFSGGALACKFKVETMNVLRRQFYTFQLFFSPSAAYLGKSAVFLQHMFYLLSFSPLGLALTFN